MSFIGLSKQLQRNFLGQCLGFSKIFLGPKINADYSGIDHCVLAYHFPADNILSAYIICVFCLGFMLYKNVSLHRYS